MIAVIAAAFQLALLLLTQWFKFTDEKKAKAKEILKEVKSAKDVNSVTAIFDKLNSL